MKFVLAVALVLVAATVASANRRVHLRDSSFPMPAGWKLEGRRQHQHGDHHPVKFHVALTQQNLDVLEAKFWAVSDPKSPEYGQHLTTEQITEIVRPTSEATNLVTAWLEAHDVEYTVTGNEDYLLVHTTVAKAEALLNTEYKVFNHRNGARVPASLGPISIPAHLEEHIHIITGATGLPNFNMKVGPVHAKKTVKGDADAYNIIPSTILARYNVTDGNDGTATGNLQGVAEFQGQYYTPADLCTFYENYNVTGNCSIDRVIGPNHEQQEGMEAALDVQYIKGVAPAVPTWFYSYGSFNFYADLNGWLAELGNETTIPNVITVSYGSQGDYPPFSYQLRADTEYQKVGTRGTSILYASGDTGSGCQETSELYQGGGSDVLAPSYPAISPYVTSVGATKFQANNTGPEASVGPFYKSGGGFSWMHPRPSYQDDAVSAYLSANASSLPPASAFNASGRATPDVAALGSVHFQIIIGGQATTIGGTSAAAPTFGGIVSLLNAVRLNAGNPTLGFLNPWLYQSAASNANAFFDVTVGDNIENCGYDSLGFLNEAGWDPVSGLGTPNYEILKTLL